jgi:hypothetical protein
VHELLIRCYTCCIAYFVHYGSSTLPCHLEGSLSKVYLGWSSPNSSVPMIMYVERNACSFVFKKREKRKEILESQGVAHCCPFQSWQPSRVRIGIKGGGGIGLGPWFGRRILPGQRKTRKRLQSPLEFPFLQHKWEWIPPSGWTWSCHSPMYGTSYGSRLAKHQHKEPVFFYKFSFIERVAPMK